MPEPRAVIGHGVSGSRDVVVSWDVAVEPLVMSLGAEKVGRRFRRGGGAFAEPIDTGDIVRQSCDCTFANIGRVRDDVVVGDIAAQLELAVVNGTSGVAKGYQLVLDVLGKGGPPQMWGRVVPDRIWDKEDTSHTRSCCITGSNDFGVGRDEFCDAGRAIGDIFC